MLHLKHVLFLVVTLPFLASSAHAEVSFFDRLARAYQAFIGENQVHSQTNREPAQAGRLAPPSTMRGQGCGQLDRKICKSKHSGFCEAVYIASENASPECKSLSPANIEQVCGDREAKLFNSDSECVAPVPSNDCPKEIGDVRQSDIEKLYSCPAIQPSLCKQLCGSRYDSIDIRNFYQTDRKPGVTCIDGSSEDQRNGVAYNEDPVRKSCTENHQGNSAWCVSYNKSHNGVNYGAFVQCVGKTK